MLHALPAPVAVQDLLHFHKRGPAVGVHLQDVAKDFVELGRVLLVEQIQHFVEVWFAEGALAVVVAGRGVGQLSSLEDGDTHAEDSFLAQGQVGVHPIEVLEFFGGVVDARGEYRSVIFVYEVVVDDLEVSVGVDEYLSGVEGDDGLELAEGVGAGLQDAPQLGLFEALALLASGEYFLPEGDLRVFKDGVDFKRGRAEVIKNLGLHLDRTDDVLLDALLHLRLQAAQFTEVGLLGGEGVLLEEVVELALAVQQDHSSRLPL